MYSYFIEWLWAIKEGIEAGITTYREYRYETAFTAHIRKPAKEGRVIGSDTVQLHIVK